MGMLYRVAWKEFHELKWSVIGTAAIVVTVPLYYMFRDPSMTLFVTTFTFFVYPTIVGALFGAHAAASERVARTAPFVSALPIQAQVLGLMKLVASCVGAVLP